MNIISNGSVASLSSGEDKIDKKVILNPEDEEQSAIQRQDQISNGVQSNGKISSFGSQNKTAIIASNENVIPRKQTVLKQTDMTNNENKSFTQC